MRCFIQSFFDAKSLLTRVFYSALLTTWLFLASLSAAPLLQRLMMEKMHLRTSFFPAWMAFQTIPSMYNFSNEVWISSKRQSFLNGDNNISHVWVNHYPLRLLTFTLQRDHFFPGYSGPIYVYIRSQYRGTILTNSYKFYWDEKLGSSHRVLALFEEAKRP